MVIIGTFIQEAINSTSSGVVNEKIVDFGSSTLNKGINILLIIIVGLIVNLIVKHAVKNTIGHAKINITTKKKETLTSVLSSVFRYIISFIVIFQILDLFIQTQLVLAVTGVGSVAIGFGTQSIVKDIISGLFILFENQFAVGDIVTLQGFSGTVEDIGMRTTRIRNADGNVHIIPNGEIKVVTNMTKEFNRVFFVVKVSYFEDIERVIEVLNQELAKAFTEVEGLINEPPKVLGVTELDDSSVNIRISGDCAIEKNWALERELLKRIKIRFDYENIEIPYNQSVVHIKNI